MSIPEPYWTNGQVDLHHADCLDLLPLLPAESVDAVKLARTRLGKDIQPDLFGGGSDAA